MKAEDQKQNEKACSSSEDGVMNESVELPAIDFSAFVFSLSHNALSHLEDAKQNQTQANIMLPLAKQFIDILEMLKKKTKGNLTKEEDKFLQSLLFDLRVNYLDACKKNT